MASDISVTYCSEYTYRNNFLGKSPRQGIEQRIAVLRKKEPVVFKTTHEKALCNVLVIGKGALHTLVIYILYVYQFKGNNQGRYRYSRNLKEVFLIPFIYQKFIKYVQPKDKLFKINKNVRNSFIFSIIQKRSSTNDIR